MRLLARLLVIVSFGFLFSLPAAHPQPMLVDKDLTSLLKQYDDYTIRFGEGEESLYAFIDPKCPFSKKFVATFFQNKQMQKKYTLRLFLYELIKLDSHEYIKLILSSNRKELLLKKIMIHDFKPKEDDFIEYRDREEKRVVADIKQIITLAQQLKVNKRPFLIINGKVVGADAHSGRDMMISPEEAIGLVGKEDVVFVNGEEHSEFMNQHIKNSVSMPAKTLRAVNLLGQSDCSPLYRCLDDAQNYIRSKGITNDTLVIAYSSSLGPKAFGVYAFFKSYGHHKLKVLNGGMEALKKADINHKEYLILKKRYQEAIAKEDKKILKKRLSVMKKRISLSNGKERVSQPSHYRIDMKTINYDYIADKYEILNAVNDIKKSGKKSHYAIIDTRNIAEIIGKKKIGGVARGGHIPGAVFIEWNRVIDPANKRSLKPKKALKKLFAQFGITKDKKIYTYCHVGAGRNSHILAALELLGYKNIKLYTGSWNEWGNDLNMPSVR
jgi:thiosulfate/3-mercaptopyruvate sulfurtransferase